MEGETWEERFWTLEYLVWDGRRGGGDDVRFRNRGWARGGLCMRMRTWETWETWACGGERAEAVGGKGEKWRVRPYGSGVGY
jgi:hypothetical protein